MNAIRYPMPYFAEVLERPWRYSLLHLMRLLDVVNADLPRIGEAQLPQQELIKLGQYASLVFAPREIAFVEASAGKIQIRVFGLGMIAAVPDIPSRPGFVLDKKSGLRKLFPPAAHFLGQGHAKGCGPRDECVNALKI